MTEKLDVKNKPYSPFLKSLKFRKNKLVRFVSNYGANISDATKFSIKPFTCCELIETAKDKDEKILKEKKQNSKKRKKLLNLLYFGLNIIVIAIVLVIQLSGETDPKNSISEILNANWWFILAAFACFAFGMFLEQIRFAVLIHKATNVFRINLSYKTAAVGRYYDIITPLSTGGQPFQVIYLNRYGIRAGEGISIAMAKYIFYQIIFFLGVSFFIFRDLFLNLNNTATNTVIASATGGVATGFATTLSWIGYVVTAVVILTVTFISLNKRAGAGFVVSILKLLSKIKIGKFRVIKDYKKSFQSVMKTVNIWQRTTKKYSKSPGVILVCLFSSIAYFLINYSIPYFIYCAFEGWDFSMLMQIATISIMVDLASAFNPIPMGTGSADLSFTAFFATIFSTTGAQIWALIIWRILAYYIYILQGFFVLSYDYFVGNKRLEKNKEFWMLPIKERIKLFGRKK